ncbi:MAG: hypothetical protein JJV89_02120 [Desulfosarcina sp.]|nr:hypothetical protein [Desulfobacterales bacterium]
MTTAKIAITMKKDILTRLDLLVKSRIFPNRSKAIQDAVETGLKPVSTTGQNH